MSRGQLVGVISDRDLFKAVSPFLGTFSETEPDLSTLQKRVHQVMTRKLIAVSKDIPIKKSRPDSQGRKRLVFACGYGGQKD
ncbi:MAG: hypothetical protein VST68_12245 [Nitrospirota bacterium]|nr:hypothetical protein [Nitrospirota bacterium]